MSDLRVIERIFSNNNHSPTILIANMQISNNIQTNLNKIEEIIEIAHKKNVNIVILPELCITGYIWNTKNTKEVYDHLLAGENNQISKWIKNIRNSFENNGLEYIFYNNAVLKNNELYNASFVLNCNVNYWDERYIYNKIFLSEIEKKYFKSGSDKRLTIDTKWGRFGFLICYDLNFVELAKQYTFTDEVDAIVTMAAWRSEATREYPMMNVKTDHYYGFLWDLMNSSKAAYNQIWSLGANIVGEHEKDGTYFWGGSGIWTPSGLQLLRASNIKEELILIRNLDIKGEKQKERNKLNYSIDFKEFHRKLKENKKNVKYTM